MEEAEKLLSCEDVRERIGLKSVETVRRWVRRWFDGDHETGLRASNVGSERAPDYRIARGDLRDFLRRRSEMSRRVA